MNISITPQLEEFLQERVRTGRYNNVSEAVRAAVRLLQLQEQQYEAHLAALRKEIDLGFEEDTVPYTRALVEDIKAHGRERMRLSDDTKQ